MLAQPAYVAATVRISLEGQASSLPQAVAGNTPSVFYSPPLPAEPPTLGPQLPVGIESAACPVCRCMQATMTNDAPALLLLCHQHCSNWVPRSRFKPRLSHFLLCGFGVDYAVSLSLVFFFLICKLKITECILCKDVLQKVTQWGPGPGGTECGTCGSWLGALMNGM